jgi:hypothetical protein
MPSPDRLEMIIHVSQREFLMCGSRRGPRNSQLSTEDRQSRLTAVERLDYRGCRAWLSGSPKACRSPHRAAPRIEMEVNYTSVWEADWAWGVPLIVLTSVVHVLGLGLINERIVQALSGRTDRRHPTFMFAVAMSVAILLATVLHAGEAAVWAAAYILLRAVPDMKAAMLYSVSALTTYGHASTDLAGRWRMLGALEALNGMLLFGLTTAFLFAMIQEIWSLESRARPPKS